MVFTLVLLALAAYAIAQSESYDEPVDESTPGEVVLPPNEESTEFTDEYEPPAEESKQVYDEYNDYEGQSSLWEGGEPPFGDEGPAPNIPAESLEENAWNSSLPNEYDEPINESLLKKAQAEYDMYIAAANGTPQQPAATLPEKLGRYTSEDRKAVANFTPPPVDLTPENLRICGGTPLYCMVDFDSTGDGKLECCTGENNVVCKGCRDYCVRECGMEDRGVRSCFMAETTPLCQCSNQTPTCYTLPALLAKKAKPVSETAGINALFYIVLLGIMLLAIAGAAYFAQRIG